MTILVTILHGGPGVSGDCFDLLATILEKDVVAVWHSGFGTQEVTEGIPEGGAFGTFGYTALPDTLARELLAEGCA